MYISTQIRTEYSLSVGELKKFISTAEDDNIVLELEELLEETGLPYDLDDTQYDSEIAYIDSENISGELATFFNENSDVREWE